MAGVHLSLRSTRYYAGSHLGVLAGIALAVGVLVGALLVGDSVRYTLSRSAELRLGGAEFALDTKDRLFPDDLADRLQSGTSRDIAPALLLRGVAIGPSGKQVNSIQIVGMDERFRGLAGQPGVRIRENEIAINDKLAGELGVKPGDSISIRFSKPSLMPRDAPLSSRKGDDAVRRAFTVAAVWGDEQSGRFSLSANQVVPFNAFVDLGSLQGLAGVSNQANLLLAGPRKAVLGDAGDGDLDAALRKAWILADLGLSWRNLPGRTVEQLESDRIMLDPAVGRAVAGWENAAGTLTYLVNSITREGGTNSTPYSFVLAMAPVPGSISEGMKDDEIRVNRWLADQLSLQTGGSVRLVFYQFTAGGRYVETSRVFRVSGIVEMEALRQERELAPKFPGLTDAGRCADWDIGMPLDPEKMEDKANEAYWDAWRDTPKAVVTLGAGQAMWANRFGDLTAIRFKPGDDSRAAVERELLGRISPSDAGLFFTPVRRIALKAAGESMDFGQLFLGMSSFVMIAALMLTAMLFSFSIQQRAREAGILLAVGFTPARVRWMLIREGLVVAGAGAGVGAAWGILYTHALIWGLGHGWQGAVASAAIQFHAEPLTIMKGVVAGFAMGMIALGVATWRQTSMPARELLGERASGVQEFRCSASCGQRRTWRVGVVLPWFGLASAIALVGLGLAGILENPVEVFFAAGSLLLVSLLGLIRLYLLRLARAKGRFTLGSLGTRNLGRRRNRSLTVAGLVAVGFFMVFAVSSMQEDIGRTAAERSSGTGGFALLGDSAIPILADLSTADGWKKLRLDQEEALAGVALVPIKVRDGDDASCLNLNRAQSPRLLGVDPGAFGSRGAFGREWAMLDRPLPDGCVPGLVGDANTAQWGLRKRTGREDGDILLFRDERGGIFKVRLVGTLPMRVSVFQGSVLIPAAAFAERYPSESGIRMILADVPRGKEFMARAALERRLGKFGLNVMKTVDRLKEFHAVEATYLSVFLMLGGLGLLLGSAGLAIVVLRAIRERRAELALLKAVGFPEDRIRGLVAGEHRLMVGLGLAAGGVASLAAMWPSVNSPGVELPVTTMLAFLAGIIIFHVAWITLAIRWSLREPLVSALRGQ